MAGLEITKSQPSKLQVSAVRTQRPDVQATAEKARGKAPIERWTGPRLQMTSFCESLATVWETQKPEGPTQKQNRNPSLNYSKILVRGGVAVYLLPLSYPAVLQSGFFSLLLGP